MSETGTILSILRFSLDDGPGIRTTVFLKGCALSCQWCHNPESKNPTPELAFFAEKCTRCGACAKVCPTQAHTFTINTHILDRDKCNNCGLCAAACLFDALKLSGEAMDAQTVMTEVLKDKHYYASSNGGLTVSGGEPLYQPTFLFELLTRAREQNIHTCIETSGHASRKVIDKIFPLVDYFLFDIKAGEQVRHKTLTGVENSQLLSNLDYLYQRQANIEIRCPMVAGMNDTQADLQHLVLLEKKYPKLKAITLMPYHNIGNAKYHQYGFDNSLPTLPNTSEETKAEWMKTLQEMGSTKIRLS